MGLISKELELLKKIEEEQRKSALLEQKNEQLQAEINNIYNSTTWKMTLKLRNFLLKSGLYSLSKRKKFKQENKEKMVTTSGQAALMTNQIKEFDYDHMLNGYEYLFLNYKEKREKNYLLNTRKINNFSMPGLVSVILPVFNGEDYIKESIKSVLAQTYTDFELIVLNDGSTDKTPQILDEYQKLDQRIKVVHQANMKLPRTLSKGFRLAKGEFLTWTSADNNMKPAFLERFVKEMQDHPDVDMVYGNISLIDENGMLIKNNQWFPSPEDASCVILPKNILELNTYENNYIGAAFMYRSQVADIVEDYSEFKYCTEDYDYWMRINSLLTLRHVSFDEPLYDYRLHSNSLTSRDKELKITENRHQLMLLDRFRRDYYQLKSVWLLEDTLLKVDFGKELRERLLKKGDIVLKQTEFNVEQFNQYENFISVSQSPILAEEIISNAFTVQIKLEETFQKAEHRDCYIDVTGTVNERIDRYQGWYGIEAVSDFIAFVDTKSKNRKLYAIEEKMVKEVEEKKEIAVLISYSNPVNLSNCLMTIDNSEKRLKVYIVCAVNEIENVKRIAPQYRLNICIKGSYAEDYITYKNIAIWESKERYLLLVDDAITFSKDYFTNLFMLLHYESDFNMMFGNVYADNAEQYSSEVRDALGIFEVKNNSIWSDSEIKNVSSSNVVISRSAIYKIGGLYHLLLNEKKSYSAPIYLFALLVKKYLGYSFMAEGISAKLMIADNENMKYLLERHLLSYYKLELENVVPLNTYPEGIGKKIEELGDERSNLSYKVALNALRTENRKDFFAKTNIESVRERYSELKCFYRYKISVIVPIYNVEEFLRKCVDSILSQTLQEIEVILVNDESPDNCLQICEEYVAKDSRIKIIDKKNGGLSDARNAGIDIAQGEFLAFIDADDYIDEDMFEILYDLAIEYQVKIAECGYRSIFIDKVKEESGNSGQIYFGDSIFALKSQLEWGAFKSVAWNKIYHHSLFKDPQNRYPIGKYHEDEFFTHKLFYDAKRLVSIDKAKYNYLRTRDGSITGKVSTKILDSCYALRERVNFVIENKLDELIVPTQNMYCWILFDRLKLCYDNNLRDGRVEELLNFIRQDHAVVKGWNCAEEYKKIYVQLCNSYDEFGKNYKAGRQ